MGIDRDVFRLAILTISDAGSKGERPDTSGEVISEISSRRGFLELFREIVPDEKDVIREKLISWCDSEDVDVIITTGGTGLGPRDVTPEATKSVVDYEVPGIAEAMRMQTIKITPLASLIRGVVGVRSKCLIVNLPGSPKAVRETLDVVIDVIPHGLEMIRGRRGHPLV